MPSSPILISFFSPPTPRQGKFWRTIKPCFRGLCFYWPMTSGSHFSSQLPIKVSFLKKSFIPKSSFQASWQDNGNFPTKHPHQSLNREWLKNFFLPRIQLSPLHFTSKSDQSCLCTIFLSQLEFHLKFSVVSQGIPKHARIHPLFLTSTSANKVSATVTSSPDKEN